MGLDLQTLQTQFTDVGKLVTTSMDMFDRVKSSLGLATNPIAAAPVASPVTPTAQTTQASAPSSLFGGSGLIWVVGIGLGLYALSKMRR